MAAHRQKYPAKYWLSILVASFLILFHLGSSAHAFVSTDPSLRVAPTSLRQIQCLPQRRSGVIRTTKLAESPSSSGVGGASDSDESSNEDDTSSPKSEGASSPPPGGADLSDRFKHKVHALMGDYDPPSGMTDDENQTGNILGAMLQFPTEYTFTVVGRTGQSTDSTETSGECDRASPADAYTDQVKAVLASVVGPDTGTELRSVPRGKNFTRVSCKVMVESATMISTVYDELGALDLTVMKF